MSTSIIYFYLMCIVLAAILLALAVGYLYVSYKTSEMSIVIEDMQHKINILNSSVFDHLYNS